MELSFLDPTLLAAITAAIAAAYAAYLKGKEKGTAAVTEPVPATGGATVTTGTTISTEMPTTQIFDAAQHGGNGPNFWTWEQMRTMVAFKVSEETKKNMLDGLESAKDQKDILDAIATAEKTNEYLYTIDYDHGFYMMKAVCSPVGTTEYKYQVVVASSGMDKQ